MVQPVAKIRPAEVSDQRRIRFVVGKAEMEPIAIANRKLYANPLVISLWIGLSCVFIEYMNWWPKPEHGLLGYLAPFPGFAALSVAFMFAIDWLNRWDFDDRSNHVLRRPDLVDIPAYYSRSPSSGFWILEWDDRFIGMIALDASLDADQDQQLAQGTVKEDRTGQVKMTKGTSKIATIRHFHVEEPYRPAGMQDDLLKYALDHAFKADTKLEGVRAISSPLREYISDSLKKHGFRLESKAERVGALRWQHTIHILDRTRWASQATGAE